LEDTSVLDVEFITSLLVVVKPIVCD
jgi:hypothetical protein